MKPQTKLLLFLLLSIASIYGAIQYFQQRHLGRQISELATSSLGHEEDLAWVAIENLQRSCNLALNDAMVEGEMDRFKRLLAGQAQTAGLQELTVFTKDGLATNSTVPAVVKTKLPEELKARIQQSSEMWRERTAESFILYQPMPVTKGCIECHPAYKTLKSGGVYRYKFSTDTLLQAQNKWKTFETQLHRSSLVSSLVAALVLLTAATGVIFLIVRRQLTLPLRNAAEATRALAQGDLTYEVAGSGNDQLGELGVALAATKTRLRSIVTELAANSRELNHSAQVLTETATTQASGAEHTTMQANTVASAGEELSINAKTMSGSAAQITQSTGTVAAAMEKMAASIQAVARNCANESEIARKADAQASATRELMGKLDESARQIGKVVELINRIAEQTNLLALNATIEAASAGEAGRGFAVVANEVKALARQSAAATEDIRKQVALIQDNTGASIQSLDEVAQVIGQVSQISATIAAAVEEQSATSAQIVGTIHGVTTASGSLSLNVQQTAEGAAEVAKNIAGVSTAAADGAKGAAQIRSSAAELSQLSATLRRIVEQFKI